MCLGIPMQVKQIDGFVARCEAKGVEREVNLFMLQDDEIAIGDYVMVYARRGGQQPNSTTWCHRGSVTP